MRHSSAKVSVEAGYQRAVCQAPSKISGNILSVNKSQLPVLTKAAAFKKNIETPANVF